MDKKHRYSAGMLAAALIVGIGIGFCGGFAVGGHTGSRQQNMAAGAEQNFETGDLSMEESQKTESGTDSSGETEIEPIGSYAVDDEPVLTIDDTTVYLSEINARAYMARDQYVADYGEEPWDTKMDNGMTVGEYAKATMLDEIERAVILCNKADEYVASIGEDIATQFSVEQSAVLAIYEKDALSMKVYNQILENLSETLRQEDDYKDMEDSEFEQVLNDKFEEQYAQWKDTCKVETTETWEQLVIGAVG